VRRNCDSSPAIREISFEMSALDFIAPLKQHGVSPESMGGTPMLHSKGDTDVSTRAAG
jgi:hypothetical protein